jgi:protein required for attachment to host cells
MGKTMRIARDACVLVTDGRKFLYFRNDGDADFPNLKIVRKRVDPNPADRLQKSDAPGRTYSSSLSGSRRSAFSETDFHQKSEDAFAMAAAEFLREQALAGEFQSLIVVAPPRTLGELRKHYHDEVSRRLAAEIPKDLVKHPVAEIESIIAQS